MAAPQRGTRQGQDAPRLLVDLTGAMIPGDAMPTAAARLELELARLLLARPALGPMAVAFDARGRMFALGEDALEPIITRALSGPAMRLRAPSAAPDVPAPVASAPEPPDDRVTQPRRRSGVVSTLTGCARAVARGGIRLLPESIREDCRAILIHARQIMRTAMYRPAPMAHPDTDQAVAEAAPPPLPALPTLRVELHPRCGDVLWTAAFRDGPAQLRLIAELERYRGMKVAAYLHGPAGPATPPVAAAPIMSAAEEAVAIDTLRVATLAVAGSEASRAAFLATAARLGMGAPPVQVLRPGSALARQHTRSDSAPVRLPVGLDEAARFALALPTGIPGSGQQLAALLRAWRSVASNPGVMRRLVVVGGPSAGADDALGAFNAKPARGRGIIWIERCSNEVLAALHQAAAVVLVPGQDEEAVSAVSDALAFGRPVVAMAGTAPPDTPPGLVTLVDPGDEKSWAGALQAAARDAGDDGAALVAADWDACADALADALSALMQAPVEAPA